MTAKNAYRIVRAEYPDMVAIECLELADTYAFALADKGREDELLAGGYTTVNKTTGKIGGLNPLYHADAISEAKEIPINTLN